MHVDFRPLIHPGTKADEIDLDGTREKRDRIRQEIRERQIILDEIRQEELGATWPTY